MFVYQNNTGGIQVSYDYLESAPGIILAYSGMSTSISY
jgi:hypothetical protein